MWQCYKCNDVTWHCNFLCTAPTAFTVYSSVRDNSVKELIIIIIQLNLAEDSALKRQFSNLPFILKPSAWCDKCSSVVDMWLSPRFHSTWVNYWHTCWKLEHVCFINSVPLQRWAEKLRKKAMQIPAVHTVTYLWRRRIIIVVHGIPVLYVPSLQDYRNKELLGIKSWIMNFLGYLFIWFANQQANFLLKQPQQQERKGGGEVVGFVNFPVMQQLSTAWN